MLDQFLHNLVLVEPFSYELHGIAEALNHHTVLLHFVRAFHDCGEAHNEHEHKTRATINNLKLSLLLQNTWLVHIEYNGGFLAGGSLVEVDLVFCEVLAYFRAVDSVSVLQDHVQDGLQLPLAVGHNAADLTKHLVQDSAVAFVRFVLDGEHVLLRVLRWRLVPVEALIGHLVLWEGEVAGLFVSHWRDKHLRD